MSTSMTAIRPTVKIERVSPALAEKYLASQVRNRPLRSNRVEWFVGLIERGEWELTPDCVAFDIDGHLLNGQHRLSAIARCAETLPLAVMRGLPAEAQDTMDAGLVRTLGDALRLRGESNQFAKAAALQWLFHYDFIVSNGGTQVHYNMADRPTTAQLLRLFADEGVDFLELEPKAMRVSRNVKTRPGITWALMLRQSQLDYDDMDTFWNHVIDGAGLERNDPTLLLRNQLLRDASMKGGRRMAPYRMAALIAKAWNLYRDGDRREHLSWHYGGRQNDVFPIMH